MGMRRPAPRFDDPAAILVPVVLKMRIIGAVMTTAGAAGVAIELGRSGDRVGHLAAAGAWTMAGLVLVLACARFVWRRQFRPTPAPSRATIEPHRTTLRREGSQWAAVATVVPLTSALAGVSRLSFAGVWLGVGVGGLVVAAALRRRERRGGFLFAHARITPGLPWRRRGADARYDEPGRLTIKYYEVAIPTGC
jgi:hypothetical protein